MVIEFKEATVVFLSGMVSVSEEIEDVTKLLLHVVDLRLGVSVTMGVRDASSRLKFVGLSSSLTFSYQSF